MKISNSSKTHCPGPEAAIESPSAERLTEGRVLVRNTGLNLIGQAGPLVIAIFAIPILIKALGVDRFGVLTLAWVVIGYFCLFDFGMGRALTKFVAERLGTRQEQGLPALVWTSLFIMFVFGMVGTVVMSVLSPWLVRRALNIPVGLHAETLYAFYLLAFCIPVVITTAGIRGILEAKQRFGFINVMSITMGAFTFLAPLLVILFSKDLLSIIAALAAGRFFVLVLHLIFCFYAMPTLRKRIAFDHSVVAPLLRFGGWITVINIVSPFMAYLDRFLVAALVSVAAVAYYVTPHSVVSKLLVVPVAIAGVLFPAFATSFVQDQKRTVLLFARAVKYVFMATFPIALFIVIFAKQVLDLWLSIEFAEHGTLVLQLLTIGFFFNCLAQIPFALIQSAGRPSLTAKVQLIELPFYLVAVWSMTRSFGIEGTAIAWSVRAIVDALILFRVTRHLFPKRSFGFQHVELLSCLVLLVFLFGMVPKDVIVNATLLIFTILLFLCANWFVLLDDGERLILRTSLTNLLNFIRTNFSAQ